MPTRALVPVADARRFNLLGPNRSGRSQLRVYVAEYDARCRRWRRRRRYAVAICTIPGEARPMRVNECVSSHSGFSTFPFFRCSFQLHFTVRSHTTTIYLVAAFKHPYRFVAKLPLSNGSHYVLRCWNSMTMTIMMIKCHCWYAFIAGFHHSFATPFLCLLDGAECLCPV